MICLSLSLFPFRFQLWSILSTPFICGGGRGRWKGGKSGFLGWLPHCVRHGQLTREWEAENAQNQEILRDFFSLLLHLLLLLLVTWGLPFPPFPTHTHTHTHIQHDKCSYTHMVFCVALLLWERGGWGKAPCYSTCIAVTQSSLWWSLLLLLLLLCICGLDGTNVNCSIHPGRGNWWRVPTEYY